jgi:hypothetical protein
MSQGLLTSIPKIVRSLLKRFSRMAASVVVDRSDVVGAAIRANTRLLSALLVFSMGVKPCCSVISVTWSRPFLQLAHLLRRGRLEDTQRLRLTCESPVLDAFAAVTPTDPDRGGDQQQRRYD